MGDKDEFLKTEEPTQHRLQKAREDGFFPASRELCASLVIIFSIAVLYFSGKIFIDGFNGLFTYGLSLINKETVEWNIVAHKAMYAVFKMIFPVMAAACLGAWISQIIQKGFNFSTKILRFDLQKGKRKLLSFYGIFNGLKSLLEIALTSIVVYVNIMINRAELVSLWNAKISDSFILILDLFMKTGLEIAFVFFLLSIPDYIFQRKMFFRNLRMSREELREEAKMLGLNFGRKK